MNAPVNRLALRADEAGASRPSPTIEDLIAVWLTDLARLLEASLPDDAMETRIEAVTRACRDFPPECFTPDTIDKALRKFNFLPRAKEVYDLLAWDAHMVEVRRRPPPQWKPFEYTPRRVWNHAAPPMTFGGPTPDWCKKREVPRARSSVAPVDLESAESSSPLRTGPPQAGLVSIDRSNVERQLRQLGYDPAGVPALTGPQLADMAHAAEAFQSLPAIERAEIETDENGGARFKPIGAAMAMACPAAEPAPAEPIAKPKMPV